MNIVHLNLVIRSLIQCGQRTISKPFSLKFNPLAFDLFRGMNHLIFNTFLIHFACVQVASLYKETNYNLEISF